jgi:formylglycine-generating enzyme required for sulfatase activity
MLKSAHDWPVMFLSSTCEDLRTLNYRDAVAKAAASAEFAVDQMEHWVARGDHPALDVCLERVSKARVLVVIVAHWYGWVPDGGTRSITWLECERAIKEGKEVLAFLVKPDHDWPETYRESGRLGRDILAATPELLKEVQRNVGLLADFKKWLSHYCRAEFTTPENLDTAVYKALRDWRERNLPGERLPEGDPSEYLRWLGERTSRIDIRGLQVGEGKAHHFPIEELYIPLTTQSRDDRKDVAAPRAVPLGTALSHARLLVVGDPGSGKTTFLRRIAFLRCQSAGDFPLLISLAELAAHIDQTLHQKNAHPAAADSPDWLPHFLGAKGEEYGWALDAAFFRARLQRGSCLVLLDGLDEAPGEAQRDNIARLIENAAGAYKKCRFVVTSRPQGLAPLERFEKVEIDALDREAIVTFLTHWARCLGREQNFLQELIGSVDARPDIRRMAQNPVMLTALAVLQWNERRLPEQRAELYESILKWLARAREMRRGRERPDRCLELHGQLALAMQEWPGGRAVQVESRLAAEKLEELPLATAQRFLADEVVDSGILVSRGNQVRFWHLTFQEYLAARTIAGRPDEEQWERIRRENRLYRPEWRETMLLLGGVLKGQGTAKVDGLFTRVLSLLGNKPALADRARVVGLLGAILRDLASLGYKPPQEYEESARAVLGIFDAALSKGVPLKDRVEAAEALGQAGDPRLRMPSDVDYWVSIPGGRFRTGAQKKDPGKPNYDEIAQNDEPVREVNLKLFYIGRFPVTVWEYGQYLDATGATPPEDWAEQSLHPNRPVTMVNHTEASKFCEWAGCRLPTEEEWERAARGTEGRRYPWGNEDPDKEQINFSRNVGAPSPVGMFPRGNTPEGLADMAGNVWEWTSSLYKKGGTTLVVRGGSWDDDLDGARCAYRFNDYPEYRLNLLGFRCART